MARGCVIERRAQHRARYPVEDKARRNAEARRATGNGTPPSGRK